MGSAFSSEDGRTSFGLIGKPKMARVPLGSQVRIYFHGLHRWFAVCYMLFILIVHT
jgi:hypothetical protein